MGSTREEDEVRCYRRLCASYGGNPPPVAPALVRAVRRWREGGMPVARYAALMAANAIRDDRRAERKDGDRMRAAAASLAVTGPGRDVWLALSADAVLLAEALIAARDAADGRRAGPVVDRVKSELFGVLGFFRFYAALGEVTRYLEAC
jgi:hypothetical protein